MAAKPLSSEQLQEAVDLYAKFGTELAAAKHLGLHRTTFQCRLREALRRGFKTAVQVNKADSAAAIISDDKARVSLNIEDGCVLIGSDAHYWPGIVTTAHLAFCKFAREMKPKAVIMNGDAFDGSRISRHARIGWDKRPTVQEELEACQDRLGEIESSVPGAVFAFPLGNHDARFETRLANEAPEFEKIKGFHLKDHLPRWLPCWGVWINDEVVVKHRWHGGVHATYNNTLKSGVTLITGHLHSLRVTPYTDYRGTRYGVDTGTMAEPDGPQFMDYTEDGPKNWRSGFVVLNFWRGRLLQPELVQVIGEGLVDFRGQVIEV